MSVLRHISALIQVGIIGACIALTGMYAGAPLKAEDISKEQFLRDYRNALRRFQDAEKHVNFEARVQSIVDRPGFSGAEPDQRISYSASAGLEKLTVSHPEAGQGYFERVFLVDGGPGFVLRRDSPDSPFYLEFTEYALRPMNVLERTKKRILRAPYVLGSLYDLSEHMDSRELILTELKTPDATSNLYRIKFSLDLRNETMNEQVEGTFSLDPALGLALRDYQFHRVYRFSVAGSRGGKASAQSVRRVTEAKGRVDYTKDEKTGLFVPATIFSDREDAGVKGQSQVHITKWNFDAAPSSEFTLSSYGLGDYTRPRGQSGGKLAVWAFAIAVFSLPISATFYVIGKIISKRKRSRSGVTS